MAAMVQDAGSPQGPPGVFMPQEMDLSFAMSTLPIFDCQYPPGLFAMQPWALQAPMPAHRANAKLQEGSARKNTQGSKRPADLEELKRRAFQSVQHKCGATSSKASIATCSTMAGEISDRNEESAEDCSGDASAASKLYQSPTFAENIDVTLAHMQSTVPERRESAFQWVSESFWHLAFNKKGCRLVQNAMDAGTPAYNLQLLLNLRGCVKEALNSPHANYVLQKFIQLVPPQEVQFVVEELTETAQDVARQRFGCRILQRLVERCAPSQTEHMIDKVLEDTAALCKHPNGNFLIQSILQHGSPKHRSAIAKVVQADVMRLSKHRLGSHIVICALAHCSAEDIQSLTDAVVADADECYKLSCREYGSFVVREVKRAVRRLHGSNEDEEATTECTKSKKVAEWIVVPSKR